MLLTLAVVALAGSHSEDAEALAEARAALIHARAERAALVARLRPARRVAEAVQERTDVALRRYLSRKKKDPRVVRAVDRARSRQDLVQTCERSAGGTCAHAEGRAARARERLRRVSERSDYAEEARALADLVLLRPSVREAAMAVETAAARLTAVLDAVATHAAVSVDGAEVWVPRTERLPTAPLRFVPQPEDVGRVIPGDGALPAPVEPGLWVRPHAGEARVLAGVAAHGLGWTGGVATEAPASGGWTVLAHGDGAAGVIDAILASDQAWGPLVLVAPTLDTLPVDALTERVSRIVIYANPRDRVLAGHEAPLGAGGRALRLLTRHPRVDGVWARGTGKQLDDTPGEAQGGLWRDLAGVLEGEPPWERALLRRGRMWEIPSKMSEDEASLPVGDAEGGKKIRGGL